MMSNLRWFGFIRFQPRKTRHQGELSGTGWTNGFRFITTNHVPWGYAFCPKKSLERFPFIYSPKKLKHCNKPFKIISISCAKYFCIILKRLFTTLFYVELRRGLSFSALGQRECQLKSSLLWYRLQARALLCVTFAREYFFQDFSSFHPFIHGFIFK